MHTKGLESTADIIMFDLEDSVPLEAKDAARQEVVSSLLSMDWQGKRVTVRINGTDSPFAYRDLIGVGEKAGQLLDAVVVPKVDHPGDVHFVSRLLDGIEMQKSFSRSIGIEAIIESAQGMERIREICGASHRLKTLVFGIADYSTSIGARLVSISGHGEDDADTYPGHRWHHALSRIVNCAKAHGLMAIDAPYGNFKDPEGLERSAALAATLGCNGKWAIHPAQIDCINRMFSPSVEEISRARRILKADKAGVKAGYGAVSVDGRMIDQATVRFAKQVWEQAEYLNLTEI